LFDDPRARYPVVVGTVVALIVAFVAVLTRIGSDSQWLAALGHLIVTQHYVPAGVPFAAAPTGHWPNALVLAELVLGAFQHAFGDRGLMLAQLLAVGASMTLLARDARAGGAGSRGASAALVVAAVGALPSLAIVRVQLFSLVLFPTVVALLRSEARRPSARVWLLLPLLALWSNLHGAALLGLAVAFAYLLFVRLRQQPLTAIGVAVAAPFALCLTPALAGTVAYYHGLVSNVAAERGQGMWGPLSLSAPFDLLLIAAAIVLAARVWRARAPRWEWVVVAGLSIATIQASRNGVWLLFFLAPSAARAIAPARAWKGLVPAAARSWRGLVPAVAIAAAVLIAFTLVRGPNAQGASKPLLAQALALADGSPVLADGVIDEQVALAGGRIWVGNPIDAFTRSEQAAYLDWLAGAPSGREALVPGVRVVLAARGTATQTLMQDTPGFALVGGDRATAIYERVHTSVRG
jgi:hypothetical protein